MKSAVKGYQGDGFAVTYDIRRCIHAEQCVNGLPKVFDRDRKPWVDPTQGNQDEIAAVVRLCPTGALKLMLPDGSVAEPVPETNVVRVGPDGPLYATGDIELVDHEGTLLLWDTRIGLCRCGLSANKPLCDDSHYDQFSDPASLAEMSSTGDTDESGGRLKLTARLNGPLVFEGVVEIVGDDGSRVRKSKGAFCRCGASQKKPFCDGTHKRIGFTTEE